MISEATAVSVPAKVSVARAVAVPAAAVSVPATAVSVPTTVSVATAVVSVTFQLHAPKNARAELTLAPHVGGVGGGREKENTGNRKQHGGVRKNEDEGEVKRKRGTVDGARLWIIYIAFMVSRSLLG